MRRRRVSVFTDCIVCGRPMDRIIVQGSGHTAWRCPEMCTVREDGAVGAYYRTPLAIEMDAYYPHHRITEIGAGRRG